MKDKMLNVLKKRTSMTKALRKYHNTKQIYPNPNRQQGLQHGWIMWKIIHFTTLMWSV